MTPPPWVQRQLRDLMRLRGHAVLLTGPAGLGQYDLALALARAWLCERPSAHGACNACAACHAVDVRTHADLFVLMPEQQALDLGWPLDAATQERIERKEIKPSRQIRVEATRAAVAFTQVTHARGQGKVVLVHPAERMNAESANTLLKTLEEPPGRARFILATEAAHQLLPTIRSRCQAHAMAWPSETEGLAWLAQRAAADQTLLTQALTEADWSACWRAAGGRPQEALVWAQMGVTAQLWADLPRQLARGDWTPVAEWPIPRQLQVLMLLCHDAMAVATGAPPRYFAAEALPPNPSGRRLSAYWRALQQAWRTVEHPLQPKLWAEAWAERTRAAFARSADPSTATIHSRP
ncbi:MAG: DNA polymerase III subunit delta' [Tepidimonas sp.]|uniref:DNA polymerase III subunit delta' n=1 Tax=Tepidimonas sp. TaxID=2002775 RepID=UPI00259EB7FE|nr:DNA polymerase III subunit delta' [Tepidimonas sp.]MDM7457677.1 DNA polymerase III subunit delta' [Tepidimonas sp.]